MPSTLKRVSAPTERAITDLAKREGRTFVAQLDRVVQAGLTALGESLPEPDQPAATAPEPATATRPKSRARASA